MADTPVLLGPGNLALAGPVPLVERTNASSSAAGFLAPLTAPIYDNPLDDFFHAFLVALSTLPGQLVRPRWQEEPPNMPDFSVDWLAWGITEIEEDPFAYQGQADEDTGVVERDEILVMLMSFYGPRAGQLGKQVSASIQLAQNRAYLRAQNMTVIEVAGQVRLPALLKDKWVPRVDQRVRFRRRATWAYQIHAIEQFQGGLHNELYNTPLETTPPA
jgi:hypothetical protein